jgi:hypothetical protein
VMEKLRSRYSSSAGPSGLGTFPRLGWNAQHQQLSIISQINSRKTL